MLIKLLFIISMIVQTVAIFFAIKLVRATKYNSIWILFIMGFLMLSAERYMQLITYNGGEVSQEAFYFTGIAVSIGLSVGVMYAHKLFMYIDRLNLQRSLTSKRILSAVLRTEEKARARYSSELHDGLGPLLSGAKMSISAIEYATTDEEREEIIANTTEAIDEAIRSLREISNNLSPHILSDFGVARAVASFINKIPSREAKIRFTNNIEGVRYDEEVEVVMYRIVCELVNNSLKHARCHNISLAINYATPTHSIRVEYGDDGRGFDPEAMIDCGMGLSNIASRVNSLNGTLNIESHEGEGMRALIEIKVG